MRARCDEDRRGGHGGTGTPAERGGQRNVRFSSSSESLAQTQAMQAKPERWDGGQDRGQETLLMLAPLVTVVAEVRPR